MQDVAPDETLQVPPSPALPVLLHPFRGLRLAPRAVGDPAAVRSLARPDRDIERRIRQWERSGRLSRSPEPALYVHEYTSQGITVRGLVGAIDLTTRATGPEDRALFPHEAVHTAQSRDLARRMDGLAINPAPILLVHRAHPTLRALLRAVVARTPDWEYDDRGQQHHRIWSVTDPADWEEVNRRLARTRLLIADGHHRYAAYLIQQEAHPGTGWDRGLVMVVDQDDTPLFLGPIHRTLDGTTLPLLEETVRQVRGTIVVPTGRDEALELLSPDTWVATDGASWLSVTDPEAPDRRSAVQHLHDLVLPRLPGSPDVQFHHSAEAALNGASAGQVCVLLPAPDVALLERIVYAGRLLPEKATSFQPKPSIGALMRSPEHD